MTQDQLAGLVGCSDRTVRQAESGRALAGIVLQLAVALGFEVSGRSLPPGEHLGARLRSLRERLGMGRRQVASIAGVSSTTAAAMERGELGHWAVVERVADALGARMTLVPHGQAVSFFNSAATSSVNDTWETPVDFLERLYPLLGKAFDLDPCSPGRFQSRVRARIHYTRDDDGLRLPWCGSVYMNPPYGRAIPAWAAKARAEVAAGRATFVLGLIPARTDTRWWHQDVAVHASIWLLRGRLAFVDGQAPAPFPSALILWGGTNELSQRISLEFSEAHHVR
jgi:phage N-6-adenine-methyltransferase